MIAFLMRIIAILCTSVLFIPSISNVKYSPVNKDTIKLNAVLVSDVHIEGNSMQRYNRFGKTLTGAFASEYPVDVFALTGDNTMNGQTIEWFDFYGMLCRYNKADEVLVAFGNHDFGNCDDHSTYETLSKRCIKSYNDYLSENIDKVYYSKDIKGYKFIVLSSEDNAEDTVSVISDAQIEWLKEQLNEAAENHMPAFVLNHNLVRGKNGSRSYAHFNLTSNNDKLENALSDCGTTVIYFSGHSHYGISDSTVYTEGNVTYVNLPSSGNTGNYAAENIYSDSCNGCIMEVYENEVVLRFRNFNNNKWIDNFDSIVIPVN